MSEQNKPDDDFNEKVKAYLKENLKLTRYVCRTDGQYLAYMSLTLDNEEIDRVVVY